MWSIDFVQVPKDEKPLPPEEISEAKNSPEITQTRAPSEDSPCEDRVIEIVKRLSSAGNLKIKPNYSRHSRQFRAFSVKVLVKRLSFPDGFFKVS